jgi:hypothetical protein
MTEKEIRERIERFLKRTAEVVVVPATMGLGLSQAGCDQHSLSAGPADAGAEVQKSDTAGKSDVPDPILPYLVFRPDVAPPPADTGPDGTRDGGADVESEAGRSIDTGEEAPRRMDLASELPMPPPPYLAVLPPDPAPEAPDARPDAPEARPDLPEARPDAADARYTSESLALDVPPPPPPYLAPPPPPPPPTTTSKK